MESLITKYDHIFFNESRISELIDNYTKTSKEKLDALGILINRYIICRGRNVPGSSPMSMLITIGKEFEPNLLRNIITELAGEEERRSIVVQSAHGFTYISLY